VRSKVTKSLQERVALLKEQLEKQSSLVSEECGSYETCSWLVNQTPVHTFSKYPFNNFSKSR